jgi:hypothetical protein
MKIIINYIMKEKIEINEMNILSNEMMEICEEISDGIIMNVMIKTLKEIEQTKYETVYPKEEILILLKMFSNMIEIKQDKNDIIKLSIITIINKNLNQMTNIENFEKKEVIAGLYLISLYFFVNNKIKIR